MTYEPSGVITVEVYIQTTQSSVHLNLAYRFANKNGHVNFEGEP